MSHLPNYVYYPQFARISPEKLVITIWNVPLYALLELGTFVLPHCTLRRKVRFSLLTQLVFVLESQWKMVQPKLVLWVLYIVQSSLEHFGSCSLCNVWFSPLMLLIVMSVLLVVITSADYTLSSLG